jgi:hypothetical protein
MPEAFRDSFVITEDDYYEMAGREHKGTLIPREIHAKIAQSGVVFLGYGLGDIHIRHALLMKNNERYTRITVVREISDFQRRYWGSLHVEGLAMEIDEFVSQLSTVLL